jgi:hypothetical protein
MVMFKTRFKPLVGARPQARGTAQQQQQPQQAHAPTPTPTPPPIEKERGPQNPVREPGPGNPPERAR